MSLPLLLFSLRNCERLVTAVQGYIPQFRTTLPSEALIKSRTNKKALENSPLQGSLRVLCSGMEVNPCP